MRTLFKVVSEWGKTSSCYVGNCRNDFWHFVVFKSPQNLGLNQFRFNIFRFEQIKLNLLKLSQCSKEKEKFREKKFSQHNYTLGFLPQHQAIFLVENCRKFKDSVSVGCCWKLLYVCFNFVFVETFKRSKFSKIEIVWKALCIILLFKHYMH